ncbi:MAG: class I mannose-6-phosphate isomerase, partial [Ruminiclostridium sp.]|nr:class I mannose-6-phosphate isomerase [Ruminiclostridium sp.]
LIKLIDAKDNLSVQVHPDNEYAQRVEGEYGKTEMWYVVDCDEGAEILYGLRHSITREEFSERIRNNTLTEVTNNITVHKGDVFYIGAGTLHAIGAGVLMAEIQQNSDTTYRVYDYGRVGADGKPRELHTQKACDVTKLCVPEYPVGPAGKKRDMGGYDITLLTSCACFTVSKLDVRTSAVLNAGSASFDSVIVLDGDLTVGDVRLGKGGSLFVPAGYGEYTLAGSGEAILTNIV